MADLQVYSLGDHGVNRVMNPHEAPDDALVQAQNAQENKRAGRHALQKRPGIAAFSDVLDGAVLGLIVGGVTLPPSPATAVENINPMGDIKAALLDLVYMRCRLYLTAATTAIADNTAAAVAWTAEEYDVGALNSFTTDPDRVTIPNAGDGLYLILGQVAWATSASGKKRGLSVWKNGALQNAHAGAADDDGDGLPQQVVAVLNLVAGDYVQLKVEQDTGGALDLLGGSVNETSLLVIRLVQTVSVQLPRCHVYKSGNQTLADNLPALVPFDSEALDNATMHDVINLNTRVTVPALQGGHYLISGQFSLAPDFVGNFEAELLKNGTQVLARTKHNFIHTPTSPDLTDQVTGSFEMAAGDYVELRATYRSNASVPPTWVLLGGELAQTSLSVARVA